MPRADLSKPRPNSIKFHRIRKGLTMGALAKAIGLPATGAIEVSKWESGERRPNRFALPVLAQALDTTPEALMAPWPGGDAADVTGAA